MRKYFYDTEFIEYPRSIHLISIGVVSESGEEFYRINRVIPVNLASKWVQVNVINKLPDAEAYPELYASEDIIRNELIDFLKPSKSDPIQLWAYYADYDHVNFCWLFGPMIDLPKGISTHTMDLKQLAVHVGNPQLPPQDDAEHDALADARWNREVYFFLKEYAEQNEYELEV
jgi:hypothetical protein